MLARRQRDFGFGLAGAEMQMLEVVRNFGVERRRRRIDDQMMVARIGAVGTCRRHAHSAQAKMQRGLGGQRVAVLQSDEVDGSARGRRASGRRSGTARHRRASRRRKTRRGIDLNIFWIIANLSQYWTAKRCGICSNKLSRSARDRRIMPRGSPNDIRLPCIVNRNSAPKIPRMEPAASPCRKTPDKACYRPLDVTFIFLGVTFIFLGVLCDFRGNNDMKFRLLSVIFLTALIGSLSTEANAQRGLSTSPSADRPASADAVVAQRDQAQSRSRRNLSRLRRLPRTRGGPARRLHDGVERHAL